MIATLAVDSAVASSFTTIGYAAIGVVIAFVYWRLGVVPIPNDDLNDRVRWWLGLAILWPKALLLLCWHGLTVLRWHRRRMKRLDP